MWKKSLICLSITALSLGILTGCTAQAEENNEGLEFYQSIADSLNEVQIVDSYELTLEDLLNRDGKIIIEKCIGEVVNNDLDGKILNYPDPEHYYISYRRVEEAEVGNIILTYFIYNPDTNYEDDILYRYDYIIDGKTTENN